MTHDYDQGYADREQARIASAAMMGEEVHRELIKLFGGRHTIAYPDAIPWSQACHGLTADQFEHGMRWLRGDPPRLTIIPLAFYCICMTPPDQEIPEGLIPNTAPAPGVSRKDHVRSMLKRMQEKLRQ